MQKKHLHCVGIGGIGLSALARWYKALGWQVSGSDLNRSEITRALKKEGMAVFIGHHKSHISSTVGQVVHTNAATADNPEIAEARRRKISVISYPQAVGELAKQLKTIAVAGAHGKSTTTAMTALMLRRAKLDPTVIVGTKIKEFGNKNFRLGKSPYVVLEADEYRGAFWNYRPWIAVVTNVDREHLDFYKTAALIRKGFQKFISQVADGGYAILNADDPELRKIAAGLRNPHRARVVWFSKKDPETRRIKAALKIPGRHNISNALAAYRVGELLGIPPKKMLAALGRYRGAWRRFDFQGMFRGAKVIADYAHHPTEIKATLQAAREKFAKNRIISVFQPHHYERLAALFPEFSRAFDRSDINIILDVYRVPGREKKVEPHGANAAALARAIYARGKTCYYLSDAKNLAQFLKHICRHGDILLMLGAGSIWEMTKRLVANS